ncbi:MAG: MSMEG_0565 family glycosyltransferase [Actinomycetota bacterium]
MRIRLVTHSTRPRGGVVHATGLAEALAARGHGVELWALAPDGEPLYRRTDVPVRLVPVDRPPEEPADERVARHAEVLAAALRDAPPADVHHAEDYLSARALLALRQEGRVPAVVRTVHHVESFPSRFLEECQRASIQDVDHVICVSRFWADRLREEFGVGCDVVANGVDAARYAACPDDRAAAGRRLGWGARPTVLAVGGVEPRKGSRTLLEAFARARGRLGDGALLAIAGGDAPLDHGEFREAWRRDLDHLGLVAHEGSDVPAGVDVAVLGTVPDEDMPALYRAADVLAFPSTREGFGLVALEAMAAGLPVVVTDLPVLHEHLTDGEDCLMVPVGDSGPLAEALVRAARDAAVRDRLTAGGVATAARFTWERAAEEHERIYRGIGA